MQPTLYTEPRPDTRQLESVLAPNGVKRAVLYLRVSDPRQVKTDYDPEGISLPAQRRACTRKAEQLGLTVVDEYIEPGESATEMTRRKEFQKMLARIREQKDVDVVIVYKLARLARNRIDEALVMDLFGRRGVGLVSATEPIDDTPEGQFMQGVLSAMNQFRSQQDGAIIAYNMAEKARRGGTLGRAPIGYLNVGEIVADGYEVRTVVIDPERAPFIRQAFELYRDGNNLQDICDILSKRGLTTRPHKRWPTRAITDGKMAELLRDPYYLGYVKYKGELFPGRHPAIVDRELFDQVQEIAKERGSKGMRYRVHNHLLKGSLWCGQCHRLGLERRMILQKAEGRGGTYWYYFCRGHQAHRIEGPPCDSPYANTIRVEDAVEQHYRDVAFDAEFVVAMKDRLDQTVRDVTASDREVREQVAQTIAKLKVKEERLVDLALDDALPHDVLRERLTKVRHDREAAEAQLESIVDDVQAGAANIALALDFLANPYEMYLQASEEVRKQLNAAIFERLYVHVERDSAEVRVTDVVYRAGLSELKELERAARQFAAGERVAAQAEQTRLEAVCGRQRPTVATDASKGGLTRVGRNRGDRAATGAPDGSEAATSDREAPDTTKAAPEGGLSLYRESFTRYLTSTFVDAGQGSSKRFMVRHQGLEPRTRWLRASCSAN